MHRFTIDDVFETATGIADTTFCRSICAVIDYEHRDGGRSA